jgi:hypothetical protein
MLELHSQFHDNIFSKVPAKIFWKATLVLLDPHITCYYNTAFYQMIYGVSCAVCLNQHTITGIIICLHLNQH